MKKLFYLLIPFMLASCEKRSVELHFSEDFKAYTQFQQGSFWVYKDSATAALDTIRLEKNESDIIYYTSKFSPDYPVCDYKKLKSDALQSGYKVLSNPNGLLYFHSVATCDGFQIYESDQFQAVFFINNPKYATESRVGDTQEGYFNQLKYITYMDSLIRSGKIYKQVRVFENIGDLSPTDFRRYYWAKNVGIIKKELVDGTVWELVDFKVSQ